MLQVSEAGTAGRVDGQVDQIHDPAAPAHVLRDSDQQAAGAQHHVTLLVYFGHSNAIRVASRMAEVLAIARVVDRGLVAQPLAARMDATRRTRRVGGRGPTAGPHQDKWKATDPSMVVNVALSAGSVAAGIAGSRNTNRYP